MPNHRPFQHEHLHLACRAWLRSSTVLEPCSCDPIYRLTTDVPPHNAKRPRKARRVMNHTLPWQAARDGGAVAHWADRTSSVMPLLTVKPLRAAPEFTARLAPATKVTP